MKRFGIIILLLSGMVGGTALIYSCGGGGGGDGGPISQNVTVTGTILDSDGSPVSGATVTIFSDPVSTVTDNQGDFSLQVESGQHQLTVSKNSIVFCDISITVGGTTLIDMGSMSPTKIFYDNNHLLTAYFTYTFNSYDEWTHNVVFNSPGPDTNWFTDDDAVEYHINLERELNGDWNTWTKFVGFGNDGNWFTDDDTVEHYTLYEYDPVSGKMIRGDRYDENDVFYSYFIHSYDSTGNRVETVFYNSNDNVEHYNVFEYDSLGKNILAVEYSSSDQVNYYYTKSFNTQGKLESGIRYSHSGDGNWFDDNDIEDSYFRYFYNSAGRSYKYEHYIGYGGDGERLTDDDIWSYYYLYTHDSNGNRIQGDKYNLGIPILPFCLNGVEELSGPIVDGQLGLSASDCYSVAVSPGDNLTISLVGLTDDADLRILSPETCAPDNTGRPGTDPEDCTLTTSGNEIIIAINGNVAARYTLSVGSLLDVWQGTWSGVIDDLSGTLQEFSLQVDSGGNVVEVQVGGAVTGNTGFINEDWDENLFHVIYNTGSLLQGGVMIVDNSYRHATYADRNLYIGVLEKGAAGLPAYASSDIVGSYPVGGAYAFTQDNTGTWNWEGNAISLTVNADLTFSGNSPSGAFSGGFNSPLRSPTYGGYVGTMDVPSLGTFDIMALVSPDKTYVAAYAKEISTTPTSIYYFMLTGLIK